MTPTEVTTILRQFNKWLRGNKNGPQLESREISEAIDAAIEMIERLEATEKERDELRAKIEAMELECDAMRTMIQVALEVLDNVHGNINPERGCADELETDVKRAIAALSLYNAKGE